MNDSLDATFVEKNWKMRSKFLCPKCRGKKSGKNAYFKRHFKTYLFCEPDWDLEILPSILNSFPNLQAAVIPIHPNPGCTFFYSPEQKSTSNDDFSPSSSLVLLLNPFSRHPSFSWNLLRPQNHQKEWFSPPLPSTDDQFPFHFPLHVLVFSTDVCGSEQLFDGFTQCY